MLHADAVLHILAFVAYVAEAMTAALAAGRRTMDWVGVALLGAIAHAIVTLVAFAIGLTFRLLAIRFKWEMPKFVYDRDLH